MMKTLVKNIWILAVAIIMPLTFVSCGSDDDNDNEPSTQSGKLTGWWIHEFSTNEDGSGLASAYYFHGNECEGEYTIAKPKQSGFSKHAVGEWYYNNVIYVSNTYFVKGNEVYVNEFDNYTNADTKLLFKIVNDKLVKQKWESDGTNWTLVDGDIYTKQ